MPRDLPGNSVNKGARVPERGSPYTREQEVDDSIYLLSTLAVIWSVHPPFILLSGQQRSSSLM